ncbi:hypothetical protein JAAARDRAFT_75593 [Jaapia argillacea MUCL 33604]|uniref:AP-3 complex subunit delta n=1 Tax=Jaapia argillacea MUCL 33604 TaxID=933084 RepID=A0A067Q7J5_9AGAM|nr:hypothetical protein JAAARDRAFT_75593 [Jaapia argillacea MUCL 33604]
MWERTLQDLIRGLRANKKDESKFIAQAVDEIRKEIKSKDMELKAGAVLKLVYLDMLGHDMSWAAFHVVEVMSSPKFHLKSIGYLAAAQSFGPDTDVLMLTTNLLKKDLSSSPLDVAVTLNGLSDIVTAELARDLSRELIAMLNHSRAHIRKRAVLVLYKILLKYPEAGDSGMPRLRDRLDDPDAGVVAATVNVLCELCRRNPADYLPLAPQLFHLLTTSSNNWMLIKIIKIFGALSPHEPRLVRKLQPPITDLISTTPAISLLYECVHTCIIGGMLEGVSGHSLARLCVSKLAAFLQDSDQNLKYIALLALAKIVPTHPHFIAEYQDMILSSIDDPDISIRMRALDLVSAMVNADNLQSIIQQLLSHLVKSDPLPSAIQSLTQNSSSTPDLQPKVHTTSSQSPAYRLALAHRILTICSQSTYQHITDFEWYLSVLVDLAYVASTNVGMEIRNQLVDVVGRVRGVRGFAVRLMGKLLDDDEFVGGRDEEGSCVEVLWAAAWICGEYVSEFSDAPRILESLLRPDISSLKDETIAVYLHAATKVFGYWAAELAQRWDDAALPDVKQTVDMVISRATEFASSPDMEVQERAANMLGLFSFIRADLAAYRPTPKPDNGPDYRETAFSDINPTEIRFPKSLFLIQPLSTAYELNPVALTAQASIGIPEGLDLDIWIVPPPKEVTKETHSHHGDVGEKHRVKKIKKGKGKEQNGSAIGKGKARDLNGGTSTPSEVETPEEKVERERRKAERLERLRDDPYYILDDRSSRRPPEDVDSIPIVKLDDMPPLYRGLSDSRLQTLRDIPRRSSPVSFVVDRQGEMPNSTPLRTSSPAPAPSTPQRNGTPPPPAQPSYLVYEPVDDIPRTTTPQPIKVTRAKKKGTGTASGKKKRTGKVDTTDDSSVVP